MEEKKTTWETTAPRFVAFIDILGFKDLVSSNEHEEIYNKLSAISEHKHYLEKAAADPEMTLIVNDAEISIATFSDSIIIFSKNDSPDNFHYFLVATRWLFAQTIANNIPLKGAIAHGKISVDRTAQIYFGQPIIDAYLLEEETNYMGIVCHGSIDKYLSYTVLPNKFSKSEFLFEVKTPLKCGYLTHYNINWFKQVPNTQSDGKKAIVSLLNKFKYNASGGPRKYIDNTIDFFEKNYPDKIQLRIPPIQELSDKPFPSS